VCLPCGTHSGAVSPGGGGRAGAIFMWGGRAGAIFMWGGHAGAIFMWGGRAGAIFMWGGHAGAAPTREKQTVCTCISR